MVVRHQVSWKAIIMKASIRQVSNKFSQAPPYKNKNVFDHQLLSWKVEALKTKCHQDHRSNPASQHFFHIYMFFPCQLFTWWCSTCQLIEVQVFFRMKRATCSSHLGLACCCNVAGSRHLFLVALKGQIQRQYRFHFPTRAGYVEEEWLLLQQFRVVFTICRITLLEDHFRFVQKNSQALTDAYQTATRHEEMIILQGWVARTKLAALWRNDHD